MLGVSLQRTPRGDVLLKGTVWFRGTVTIVVEYVNVTPPSVDFANMTLLGELIGLNPPQQAPLCHAYPTTPSGLMPSEGNSLWFCLAANSPASTIGIGLAEGFPTCPTIAGLANSDRVIATGTGAVKDCICHVHPLIERAARAAVYPDILPVIPVASIEADSCSASFAQLHRHSLNGHLCDRHRS